MRKQSFVKLNPLYLYEEIKMHNFGKRQLFSCMKGYFHTVLSKDLLEITFCIFSPMVQYRKQILQILLLILNYKNYEKQSSANIESKYLYLRKRKLFQCKIKRFLTILSKEQLAITFCIFSMVQYEF
jgi:hypothetical protein